MDFEEQPMLKSQESERNSARSSYLGESQLYEDHLDEVALLQRQNVLKHMRIEVGLYSIAFVATLTLTLLANGMFIDPVIARTGCWIGLNFWAYGFTCIVFTKLVIQVLRLVCFQRYNEESIAIHIGGNFVLMPILTLVLFAFNVWMLKIPYPDEIKTYQNICETQDQFSHFFLVGFRVIAGLTYIPIFYYIVTSCMLMQTICLVRTMVTRRINAMRRREEGAAAGSDDEEGIIESMFGSILAMPLPVPEILSTLDKTTFNNKQRQMKEKLWKQCPICWSDFKRREMVTTLICDEKHVFHTSCIEEWIRKGHNTCPLCRLPIANL